MAAGFVLATIMVCPSAQAQIFEDIALTQGFAGIAGGSGNGIGGGVAWFDADGDGDLDIVLVSPSTLPVLLTQHNGLFSKDEEALLPDTPPVHVVGVAPIDFDQDGDEDLLMLRRGSNVLLRNDGPDASGNPSFTDVSERLPGDGYWSASAAVGDIDADGDDDIVIANYISGVSFPNHHCEQNSLLLNDGAGFFTDVSTTVGLNGRGCSLAVALTDYDNDGDLDVAIANDFGQFNKANSLFRNDGITPAGSSGAGLPSFSDVSEESGFGVRVYGMGVGTADVNDDGWLDYYVTSIGRQALMLGGPDGTFVDGLDEYGVGVTLADEGFQVTWAAAFEDLDADGWLDLLLSGGHIPAAPFLFNGKVVPNRLFAGGPSAPWSDEPQGWSLPMHPDNRGRGLAFADFNDDGRTDIALAHTNGLVSVYANQGPGGVPLRIAPVPR
ncbi:MAG: hypothetical protein ACI9OJ_005426, partial [Myxococcota bacterium]